MKFTSHVNDNIIMKLGNSSVRAFPSLGDSATLIDSLVKGATVTWQEYRKIKETRRKEMLDQLDGVKWPSFSDLTK